MLKHDWIDFLQQHGAQDRELSFGNLNEELRRAQDGSVLVPLTDTGLIRVSGEEATAFLHNLLTNDVKGLTPDGVQRSGLCTAKGRLLTTFLAWRDGPDLLLALPSDLHSVILKKLSMYVLRSKVKLADAGDQLVLIGLSGPGLTGAFTGTAEVPADAMKVARMEHGQIMRLDNHRCLLALAPATAASLWPTLKAKIPPAGLLAWRWLDIRAGIPTIGAALQEEFVPQMINFEVIGGVSFKKGCYPGQEIVARSQYLGKIKRRMYLAHLDEFQPEPGMHLYAPETGDQSCGRVVVSAPAPNGGSDFLAVIQTTCADAGEVHIGSSSGPCLSFRRLPYSLDLTLT